MQTDEASAFLTNLKTRRAKGKLYNDKALGCPICNNTELIDNMGDYVLCSCSPVPILQASTITQGGKNTPLEIVLQRTRIIRSGQHMVCG